MPAGDRAPQQGDVYQTFWRHVVDELAAASEEAPVLQALQASSDRPALIWPHTNRGRRRRLERRRLVIRPGFYAAREPADRAAVWLRVTI